MAEFLKGTYKVDKKIVDYDNKKDVFSEKAKASVGGSMVFIEKKRMVWKGDKVDSNFKQSNE